MNKLYTLTFLFCFSFLYSQKKELKLAQKLFKQEKVSESKETLISNSDLILNSNDSKLITQYHLLVGQIAKSEKEFSKAFDNFKLAEGNKSIKDVLKSELEFLLYEIQTYANEVYNSGNYKGLPQIIIWLLKCHLKKLIFYIMLQLVQLMEMIIKML